MMRRLKRRTTGDRRCHFPPATYASSHTPLPSYAFRRNQECEWAASCPLHHLNTYKPFSRLYRSRLAYCLLHPPGLYRTANIPLCVLLLILIIVPMETDEAHIYSIFSIIVQFSNPSLRRFNLVAMDSRLHGDSMGPVPKEWSRTHAAMDIASFMVSEKASSLEVSRFIIDTCTLNVVMAHSYRTRYNSRLATSLAYLWVLA